MEDVVKEEAVVTEEPKTETVVTSQPGEKTDSALLLKSLQDERDKRRDAEAEVARLKTQQEPGDIVSDEGKVLLTKITDLETELKNRKMNETLGALQETYPALKDKATEFQTYLSENPGVNPAMAAKAFLVDNNLIETPSRRGLEKTTGGTREAPKQGMTPEEVDDLRVNNYRKYSDMIRKGQIKL